MQIQIFTSSSYQKSYQSSVDFGAQNVSSNKALNSQDIKCCNFLTGPKPRIGEMRGTYLCLGDSLVAGASGLCPGTAM